MPKYIDTELALKMKDEESMMWAYDLTDLEEFLAGVPAADVVPRAEVDKWYHEYHAIKDELKQEKMYHRETEKLADKYFNELQATKSEVAREIFADIDSKMLCFFPASSFVNAPNTAHYSLLAMLAELKKKYTEGKQ